MATQTVKMTIQFRRDTAANWELYKDIVPAAGEPCFVLDKNILKIGDGVTTFENLEPINGVKFEIAADGKSIVLEDNVLKLIGFDAAEVGAQPRKNAEGNIEWVVPTVEADVEELKADVAEMQEVLFPSADGSETLLSKVESLTEQLNGTGENSVDAKIDAKIEAFASNLTADGKVNTLMELINYVESHGKETANMASDIQTLQDLVGTTPIEDQILDVLDANGYTANVVKEIAVNGTLLDVIDGRVDITIPEQTLAVKGSDEIDVAEDGTLSIKSISFSKIVQDEEEEIVLSGGGAAG